MVQIHPLKIENDDFCPKNLTIAQSDEIEIFIAGFTPPHTFYTIYTEGFSFKISPGDKLRHKFLKPGEYSIKCRELNWMTAKILIIPDPPNPVHKPTPTKKPNKTKKKGERNFVKKLQSSPDNLSEIFQLILNIGKIIQDKKGEMSDILIKEKICGCKLKVPDKYRLALEKFAENFEAEEFLQKMSKYEIVEKVLGVNLNREIKMKYTSSLNVEKVEIMLENRWRND